MIGMLTRGKRVRDTISYPPWVTLIIRDHADILTDGLGYKSTPHLYVWDITMNTTRLTIWTISKVNILCQITMPMTEI